MAPFVGEIPGMYYDGQKGKYFKIQKNAPAESAYSSYDVKRRKLEDEKTKSIARKEAQQNGRIRKGNLDPLTISLLTREEGLVGRLNGPQIFAKGLVYWAFMMSEGVLRSCPRFAHCYHHFAALERPDLGSSTLDILLACGPNIVRQQVYADSQSSEARGNILTRVGVDPPTSINIHQATATAIITWTVLNSDLGIRICPAALGREDIGPDVQLGPGELRGPEVDILSSTAAPESSPYLFAVGTSEGILTIDKQYVDARWVPRELFPRHHCQDVFALEFMSTSPSILMSGGRNGILNLTDLRVSNFGQQADTIKHPNSITHIKQFDSNRVIVAGLKSSLCQYDLRFCKGAHTKSILEYPEYQNTAQIKIGFDVDLESGIVAAAQEHDISHYPVQLFSLHDGQPLQSETSDIIRMTESQRFFLRPNDYTHRISQTFHRDHVIPCLRFVRDEQDRMKSLYVVGPCITKYSWGSKDL